MKLRYVDSDSFEICRERSGKAWRYFDEKGHVIRSAAEIKRLNAIALPPAYGAARFCADPLGHLQAFGLDARGRRQYRYHPDYRAAQDNSKFDNCLSFGKALPAIRKRVERDLAGSPNDYKTVLAAIVRILDVAHIRVGNEQYARDNKSFGATTLRRRHATAGREKVVLQYRGKGGIERTVAMNDRSLARVVRRCQDLPGQSLFQYVDAEGVRCHIGSADVNAYLRESVDGDFTAKDFRTWSASAIAYGALVRGDSLKPMLEEVADALGNTPAIARKSYVHPRLIEAAKDRDGVFPPLPRKTRWLNAEERGLIAYLGRSNRRAKKKS